MTEDYWLRMRDSGHLDEEGFLTVTGRGSDHIKLDTDEVVHVTPMEQRVRLELACVSQCVIVPSPTRDSLGLIITLDTIADTNNTLNLSQSAVTWFKHARFDVKTVTDVVSNMENGIKHVIQVYISIILETQVMLSGDVEMFQEEVTWANTNVTSYWVPDYY